MSWVGQKLKDSIDWIEEQITGEPPNALFLPGVQHPEESPLYYPKSMLRHTRHIKQVLIVIAVIIAIIALEQGVSTIADVGAGYWVHRIYVWMIWHQWPIG